jgi:hypothetical protein
MFLFNIQYMKFFIITTNYTKFLTQLYSKSVPQSYEEAKIKKNKQLQDTSDYLSSALRQLGHCTFDCYYNDDIMQKLWCFENFKDLLKKSLFSKQLKINRLLDYYGFPSTRNIFHDAVLLAQIDYFKPDIILNTNMPYIHHTTISEIKRRYPEITIIGQHASALTYNVNKSDKYDVVISAEKKVLNCFKQLGVRTKLIRLAFGGEKILSQIQKRTKSIDILFVGSLSFEHSQRIDFLEKIAKTYPKLEIYGQIDKTVPKNSILRKCHKGPIWGKDMYQKIADAKICLNFHIQLNNEKVSACNMRIYETAGIGTFLLTDNLEGMSDILKIGKECDTYIDSDDCIAKISHYLNHEKQREIIAKNGQKAVLNNNTYTQRAKEIIGIIKDVKRK